MAMRAVAEEGACDLGQAEAEGIAVSGVNEVEQVGGDALPVADDRPVGASAQFVGERGQRDDLPRPASSGEEGVHPGAVRLVYLRVEQRVGGDDGGVDLLGAGAGVVRLVREEQIGVRGTG
ncbi:hypothetical protein ACWD3I_44185 [Streptomyces sp. NPDC002817]|uniref:hypothetical protein n=1 Tax=Streptomyces sp. NPDC088357 TaxID=3154655 RepID=UPI003426C294